MQRRGKAPTLGVLLQNFDAVRTAGRRAGKTSLARHAGPVGLPPGLHLGKVGPGQALVFVQRHVVILR